MTQKRTNNEILVNLSSFNRNMNNEIQEMQKVKALSATTLLKVPSQISVMMNTVKEKKVDLDLKTPINFLKE